MDRWALVGRDEEQSFLAGVISDPQNAGILVAGMAGVGKTRLVREVAENAGDTHREFVTATESARLLPFGAFAHLLPENLRDIDQVDLLAVIGRHLVGRAEGRPLVINVDDVHLLDQFSAALVHHVATSRLATILLTMRSGQVAPDAITALHRDGIISRMELQSISRAEFDELLETELGGPTEITTLDQLWATTQGNVFFTHELVTDALESGTLAKDHGVWQWSSHIGFAPRIQEAVASRLGVLAPAERQLLEFLAVGEPIPLESINRLCPDASMADLERRSVLIVEEEGSRNVRLAHPLFGETIRADIPISLLRHINHELADELSEVAIPGHEDALRLAVLREAAGDHVEPQLLVEAAARANLLSDYLLAERLARSAIAEATS
ncbi:MAG TPA: AAA family ATPase, partial [Acidimicrobiales bacterium]